MIIRDFIFIIINFLNVWELKIIKIAKYSYNKLLTRTKNKSEKTFKEISIKNSKTNVFFLSLEILLLIKFCNKKKNSTFKNYNKEYI